ncbi:protein MAIN-LIKE 1-like [Vicia villosa]|uniref:protein MAIN-LIKE 1-like n=1 Tax=Vicia villosa TaxID=3911 RepID=UPI00273CA93E|nr:protein MAIN-LIKE 1-like [Vicia villosa]
MDEAPAGSSFGSRSRLARAPSSREVVREEEEEKERPTIKSVNHARKIFSLFKPQTQWFNDVVSGSRLGGLYMTGYSTISHDIQGAFVERWHKKTSSFHLPVGELTITLRDVAYLLHLPIRGRLLNHSRIQRVGAIEGIVDYLGMDPNMADYECRATSGAHITFSNLKELYENHLVAAAEFEQEGDRLFTEYHRACTLRCWFMLLIGIALFVDKSKTYVDMTYLQYFIDLTTVDQWN